MILQMGAEIYNCTVTDFNMVTPTCFLLNFETDRSLDFLPGQFLSIVIPGAGKNGKNIRRAYSIASNPEASVHELCIKIVEGGPGTQRLKLLRSGDKFDAYAPYGHFVLKDAPERDAVFISTGIGVSPFRSMQLSDSFKNSPPKRVLNLFGARYAEEVLYDDLFRNVPNSRWVVALTRPPKDWNGFTGRVTDFLLSPEADIDWKKTEFYICGNGAMINQTKEILLEKGVDKTSIHQEIYFKPKD